MTKYTLDELLIIASAREIHDNDKVVLGIGLPMVAGAVAKSLHAKNALLMMESGIIDFKPLIPLLHIADVGAIEGFSCSTDLFSMFTAVTYKGYADLCFLGVAQIDKFGNLNTTVIGDYYDFKQRLPGCGGAMDFLSYSKRTILTMNKGKFVNKLDYVTSPGYLTGGDAREKTKLFTEKSGPEKLITRKGIFEFHPDTKEMFLAKKHPGVSIDDIKKDIPWDLEISPDLTETEPPNEKELKFIRTFNPLISLGDKGYLIAFKNFLNFLPKNGKEYFSRLMKYFT